MFDRIVIDGAECSLGEAKLSDFISGFWFGAGIFETVRVRDGEPEFLGRHLRRLKRSLCALEDCVKGCDELLLDREHLARSLGRVLVANGCAHDFAGSMKISVTDGHMLLTLHAAPADLERRKRGVSVDALDRRTYRCGDPLRNHKTLAYLANYRALGHATLFANERDELCEGATANLFVELDDELVTPPLSAPCLPGIVREVLLESKTVDALRVVERALPASELTRARACVLTSSLAFATPVTGLLGRELAASHALAARISARVSEASDVD